ncbi:MULTISPECIES: helix-turn-helix domain-containing protein [Caloramator]|uniref:Probable transcription regulator, lacI/xre family n=1 Tax=Caloramator australicus RC3 TaxID=857293 RepID=I7LG62_9CLOT|nr:MULTISPECIES: XRE family transcriptional regulator [Caloramator]MDO6353929.1 XRE family transcriptional regulator [Caloramator sp. CAR-1]CCJ33030.1 probable transcription regulator, lacI/xre family [Caloramator australicus RC3]
MNRIGKRIEEARNRSSISVKELAKKLGVSPNYIMEIEMGKKIISEDMIKRIEKLLNVSLNEDLYDEVVEPVENIKDYENLPVNKEMEEAFSNILKKIPVCDVYFKEIYEYKMLPIIDKKIEGYNAEKIIFIKAPDDSMRGFRILKGDNIMIFKTSEIENNSICLIEIDKKRMIRQLKRLDANKVLLVSHGNDLKTETLDVKSFTVVGKCLKLEIDL